MRLHGCMHCTCGPPALCAALAPASRPSAEPLATVHSLDSTHKPWLQCAEPRPLFTAPLHKPCRRWVHPPSTQSTLPWPLLPAPVPCAGTLAAVRLRFEALKGAVRHKAPTRLGVYRELALAPGGLERSYPHGGGGYSFRERSGGGGGGGGEKERGKEKRPWWQVTGGGGGGTESGGWGWGCCCWWWFTC